MKKHLLCALLALIGTFALTSCSDDSDSTNPKPKPDPKPENVISYDLAPNAVILKSDYVPLITEADTEEHTLFFNTTDANVIPAVGSCLIVNVPTDVLPDGLLAKVVDIQAENGGYRVTYEDAELTDAFKELQIQQYDIDLAQNAVKFIDADGKEHAIKKTRAEISNKLNIALPDLEWKINENLSVTPHFSSEISMDLDLNVSYGVLTHLNSHFVVTPTVAADFSLGADKDVIDKRIRMGSVICGGIPLGPVVISPVIDFFLLFKVGGKVSLEGSISYKRTIDVKTFYSIEDGVNLDATLNHYAPEDGGLKTSLGAKLEGSVSYGMGTGPACAIYGKVIYTGISVDCMLKESVSGQLNLFELSTMEGLDLFKFNGLEYKYDFTAKAHFYVGSMGKDTGKDTPEYSHNISGGKLLPPIDKEVKASVKGSKATLKAKIDGVCLYDYQLVARFTKKNAKKDDKPIETYFKFTDEIDKLLEDGKSAEIEAETELEDDLYDYTVMARVNVMDKDIDFTVAKGEIVPDADGESALRAILADIYTCRDGNWKGCNWDNDSIPVTQLANVEIVKTYSPNANYEITIPEDWKLKSSGITIGNRTKYIDAKVKDGACRWELHIKGTRNLDEITIEDHCLRTIGMDGGTVKRLALRNSEIFASDDAFMYDERKFKAKVTETLDVSNSSTRRLILKDKYIGLPAREVIANECPNITDITVEGDEDDPAKYQEAPIITARNCEKLNSVTASYLKIPNKALKDISTNTTSQFYLAIMHCTLDMFSLTGCFYQSVRITDCTYKSIEANPCLALEYLIINDCQGNSVYVWYCPSLKKMEVSPMSYSSGSSKVKTVSVTECSELKELSAYKNEGLSEFEAYKLPSLNKIDVKQNTSLTGEMLPLFNEMRNRGVETYNIRFDRRYSYTLDEHRNIIDFKDNGYGYYYSDEPSVYHSF